MPGPPLLWRAGLHSLAEMAVQRSMLDVCIAGNAHHRDLHGVRGRDFTGTPLMGKSETSSNETTQSSTSAGIFPVENGLLGGFPAARTVAGSFRRKPSIRRRT